MPFRPHALTLVALATLGCGALRPAGGSRDAAAPLTDEHIAAIVVAANTADILYADLALAKSHHSAVRFFATMVKKDHESVNEAAAALATRLKLTPAEHPLSLDLRDDADTKRLTLRELEGTAFDSAYAANEVSYHRQVLGAIDETLIPGARHPELRALLVEVRPAVAAHLRHAEELVARVRRP